MYCVAVLLSFRQKCTNHEYHYNASHCIRDGVGSDMCGTGAICSSHESRSGARVVSGVLVVKFSEPYHEVVLRYAVL